VDAILGVLADHLGDVPGLPSPQAILDAGDVDERREKELRRQREEALKQQFAASRVRVVDQLGRSYATGEAAPTASCGGHFFASSSAAVLAVWT